MLRKGAVFFCGGQFVVIVEDTGGPTVTVRYEDDRTNMLYEVDILSLM